MFPSSDYPRMETKAVSGWRQHDAMRAEEERIARAAAREEPTDDELAEIDEDELDIDDLPEMTERLTRAELDEF